MMGIMKRYANPRGTFLFVGIAIVLMLVLYFGTQGRLFVPSVPEDETVVSEAEGPKYFKTSLQYSERRSRESYGPPEIAEHEFEDIIKAYSYPEAKPEPEVVAEVLSKPVKPKTVKKAPVYEPIVATGSPKIAIIIDDMGLDRKRSFEAIGIDAPLTLAFLPYAPELGGITRDARARGHELMIHMPMEAMTSPVSLGPIALKSGMGEAEVKANMKAAFASFDGYAGVNNHMGSKVTQDPQIMDWVMESLKERGLYFVDSKTIGASVGAEAARLNGLPTAERDVFLDHEDTQAFVTSALRKLEEVAARKGHAIAIGHPKDATINGLKAWLPDAQRRGFEIVHASALLERPQVKVASSKVQPSEAKEAKPRRKAEVEALMTRAEPAAGETVVKPEAAGQSGVSGEGAEEPDPNSAQAREAILKALLGQSD
ncbi:MAG: divergent polysaccharide deacetylase family protein [Alphaproteobacteria bacterium]